MDTVGVRGSELRLYGRVVDVTRRKKVCGKPKGRFPVSTWSYGHGYGMDAVGEMPGIEVDGPSSSCGPGIPGITVSGVPEVPDV